MDGFLNIYKEKGYTSHDVVAIVRRILRQKKVGHTGTLDPDAEGVLPVCLGKATKLADLVMGEKKGYHAIVRLGVTTTTQDAGGDVLMTRPVVFEEEAIHAAVQSFLGEGEQIPPMYSAIKIGGKKLYELARAGKEVERKPRPVTFYELSITSFDPPDAFGLSIVCSKGTYVRTLCADIGEKLGCGAHTASLVRTASGRFTLENAVRLDELSALAEADRLSTAVLPLDTVLEEYPKIRVTSRADRFLHNGAIVHSHDFVEAESRTPGTIVRGYDSAEQLVGLFLLIGDTEELSMKPWKMLG